MAEPDYWTRFFARLRRRQVGERLFQELVRRIQLAQEVLRRWITLRPVRLDADVEKILPLCFGDVRPHVLRRAYKNPLSGELPTRLAMGEKVDLLFDFNERESGDLRTHLEPPATHHRQPPLPPVSSR